MSKTLNTLSAIGALVMAATPLAAIGGMAHAAETGRAVHIQVADLNLGQAQDAATFRQRVDAAAETFCSERRELGLSAVNNCRQAVREEAVERLGDQQRQDLRSVQASGSTAWTLAAR